MFYTLMYSYEINVSSPNLSGVTCGWLEHVSCHVLVTSMLLQCLLDMFQVFTELHAAAFLKWGCFERVCVGVSALDPLPTEL